MNDMAKNLLLWIVIAVVLIAVFQSFNPRGTEATSIPYSDFMQQVEQNNVSSAKISATLPATITAKRKDGGSLTTVAPVEDKDMVAIMRTHQVEVSQDPVDNTGQWAHVLVDWIPFLIFIGLLVYF